MTRCAPGLGFALLLALLLGAVPDASAQLRGVRYCEVLAVKLTPSGLLADVWNTTGFNLCPQAEWEALDPVAIRAQLGALFVLLNGPRVWTLDAIAADPSGPVMTFGTLTMRLAATVSLPGGPPSPYTRVSVNRDTQFVFFAGSEVYELVDPEGHVYVMQSLSQQVDPTLTLADLPGLGSRITPPPGWSYRTRVLAADLVVEDQDGMATVIQDDLTNTYQLVLPTPVEIDIRPRARANRVRPGARGVIPVALLGSDAFDVANVDTASLAFGPAGAPPAFLRYTRTRDVDGDGFADLVAFFGIRDSGIAPGDEAACLSGEALDGTPFEGCDTVQTVPPPRARGFHRR